MECVTDFYDNNAKRFSDTRFCLWDAVKDFGNKFKKDDLVCDAGCGNGKNIKYFNSQCNLIGFDNCLNLVKICLSKGFNVTQQDILHTTYKDNQFNYIMCIAVIHHLDSEKKHLEAITELLRILKKDGELLFTLWAFETDTYSKKKNFQKGHNYINFDKSLRYYYIYSEDMLNTMLNKLNNNNIKINYWWDRGNWNIILKKY